MSSVAVAQFGMPSSIGPYRLVRELGRGGMGLVYEAVHVQLERRVALKTLRPHLLEQPGDLQRFLREGRAACRVRHPNVLEIYELGRDQGIPYLVMDLLEGVHLGARLERDGPMPLTELVDLMLPIIAAVSAAHAAGIVHRDLKPSNIMLARGRDQGIVPKVLDFGTSKLRGAGAEELLTMTGAVLGTLHYMSPEQTRAPKDADARSDQYSLGAIIYECTTGRRPFEGASAYEIMQAIMTAPLTPPSALRPGLPTAFDAVVLRAMRRQRRERYDSVAALGLALLPFASEEARKLWEHELTQARGERPAAPDELEVHAPTAEPESIAHTLAASTSPHSRGARGPLTPLLLSIVFLALWIWVAGQGQPRAEALARPQKKEAPAPSALDAPASPLQMAPAQSLAPPARAERAVVGPESAAKRGRSARIRSARSSSIGRVLLGDNGAPILE